MKSTGALAKILGYARYDMSRAQQSTITRYYFSDHAAPESQHKKAAQKLKKFAQRSRGRIDLVRGQFSQKKLEDIPRICTAVAHPPYLFIFIDRAYAEACGLISY